MLVGPAGREHSLEGRPGVHLTGWLEDDELRALVAGSRALVLPSIDEGFGLPVLEALASGRPVVVSDIPALVEVSGAFGTRAAVGDVRALAAALATVLDAPDEHRDREARRDWARRWTWAETPRRRAHRLDRPLRGQLLLAERRDGTQRIRLRERRPVRACMGGPRRRRVEEGARTPRPEGQRRLFEALECGRWRPLNSLTSRSCMR